MTPDMVSIGDRLRRCRQAVGLTLHDVERRSGGEFKASALGAYERGERALSVQRMLRLAQVLGVSVDEVVGSIAEIDLTTIHDEERLEQPTPPDEPALAALARFAGHIRSVRRGPLLEPLRVRGSDCVLMAVLFGADPEMMRQQLATLGMHAGGLEPRPPSTIARAGHTSPTR